MGSLAILLLCFSVGASADKPAAKEPAPLQVVTDASWKGSSQAGKDWQTENHNDGNWKAATPGPGPVEYGEHYGVVNVFGFASPARWIWGGDQDECYLRRSLEVPRDCRRAEMILIADDVAEFFMNGQRVAGYNTSAPTWGMRGGAVLVDLIPYLVEGKNQLAVHVKNGGGPRGFAAEIRINGEPFLKPLSDKGKNLTKDVEKEFDGLAAKLDADQFAEREKALADLIVLMKKQGPSIRGKVKALLQNDSPEVRSRATRLQEAFRKEFPDLEANPNLDIRFQMLPLDAEGILAALKAPNDQFTVQYRNLTAAQQFAARDEKALLKLLPQALNRANDRQAERVVAFVSFLELRSAIDLLEEVLKDRPATPAGAAAASALGRLGNASHLPALKAATKSGHAPTERAAKHALVQLQR